MDEDQEWYCEECREEQTTLYEGWFYTSARNNEFAIGTASAALMRRKRVCENCLERLRELGLTKKK
jgi:hypothetical protein